MTKDGVRDFIAAEYTLSENYVHGLAAFGPRLKNFESPHSSRGSSPGLPAGNSVTHNTQQAARVSDKTAFFFMGQLIEFDATDTIFNHPKLEKTRDYVNGHFG